MDKEKEIEEMVKVLEKANEPIEYDDNECCMFAYPTQKDIAEELYNAGYGNVKQAVKEFAEELKEYANALKHGTDESEEFALGFRIAKEVLLEKIDELLKERFREDNI